MSRLVLEKSKLKKKAEGSVVKSQEDGLIFFNIKREPCLCSVNFSPHITFYFIQIISFLTPFLVQMRSDIESFSMRKEWTVLFMASLFVLLYSIFEVL